MKLKLVYLIISMVFITIGCKNVQTTEITVADIERIEIKLLESREVEDGINYSFKLINGSESTIKQNNVYLSYPIKTETGHNGNEFKVEMRGNTLHIEPGAEILLTAFTPFEGMGSSDLLIDRPTIEIKGYLGTVDEKHLFNAHIPLNVE